MEKEKTKLYLRSDMFTHKSDEQILNFFSKELYRLLQEKFNYRAGFRSALNSICLSRAINKNSAICIYRYRNNNHNTEHESFFICLTYKMQYVWSKHSETERMIKYSPVFSYDVMTYEVNSLFIKIL
jgi:hypothetical protein